MTEFLGQIVDIGPSTAHNGRTRAQLHVQALNEMRKHPFKRLPGEALCNGNLLAEGSHKIAVGETEPTCSKCLTRMDRYDVRIVVHTPHTEKHPAAE